MSSSQQEVPNRDPEPEDSIEMRNQMTVRDQPEESSEADRNQASTGPNASTRNRAPTGNRVSTGGATQTGGRAALNLASGNIIMTANTEKMKASTELQISKLLPYIWHYHDFIHPDGFTTGYVPAPTYNVSKNAKIVDQWGFELVELLFEQVKLENDLTEDEKLLLERYINNRKVIYVEVKKIVDEFDYRFDEITENLKDLYCIESSWTLRVLNFNHPDLETKLGQLSELCKKSEGLLSSRAMKGVINKLRVNSSTEGEDRAATVSFLKELESFPSELRDRVRIFIADVRYLIKSFKAYVAYQYGFRKKYYYIEILGFLFAFLATSVSIFFATYVPDKKNHYIFFCVLVIFPVLILVFGFLLPKFVYDSFRFKFMTGARSHLRHAARSQEDRVANVLDRQSANMPYILPFTGQTNHEADRIKEVYKKRVELLEIKYPQARSDSDVSTILDRANNNLDEIVATSKNQSLILLKKMELVKTALDKKDLCRLLIATHNYLDPDLKTFQDCKAIQNEIEIKKLENPNQIWDDLSPAHEDVTEYVTSHENRTRRHRKDLRLARNYLYLRGKFVWSIIASGMLGSVFYYAASGIVWVLRQGNVTGNEWDSKYYKGFAITGFSLAFLSILIALVWCIMYFCVRKPLARVGFALTTEKFLLQPTVV